MKTWKISQKYYDNPLIKEKYEMKFLNNATKSGAVFFITAPHFPLHGVHLRPTVGIS
jgi:hypothetical protein